MITIQHERSSKWVLLTKIFLVFLYSYKNYCAMDVELEVFMELYDMLATHTYADLITVLHSTAE